MKKITTYTHPKIDYYKLKKNKAYKKSVLNKLKFWYFYNRYSKEIALYWVYKKFKNQLHTYLKFFNINKTQDEIVFYFDKIFYNSLCRNCGIFYISRNNKYYSACSSRCVNHLKSKDKSFRNKLSISISNYHNNLSKSDKELRNLKISKGNKKFYENESTYHKKKRLKEANIKSQITFKNKYGYDWCSKVPEIKEKALKKRIKTNIKLYGGKAPLNSIKIVEKMRRNMENKGRWMPLEEMPDYIHYKKIVYKFTNNNNLTNLYNYNKRGLKDYHLDHKVSIKYGFLNNILPYIIGNINNLEMIPSTTNISKGSRNSIELEELIKLIEKDKNEKYKSESIY